MNRFSDFNRLRFILGTIVMAGGGAALHRIGLRQYAPTSCRVKTVIKPPSGQNCLVTNQNGQLFISPQALRKVLEKLGPTFIKLGQVLSLRPDLVGEEISQELTKLQSKAPTFPYEAVKTLITEELGRPPHELFRHFEEAPVAAASLAQVHRAALPDGTEVAVKVRRPGITKVIEQDIRILYYLADQAERHYPSIRSYHPAQLVHEFSDWTRRELDFREEGVNADRFRHSFREDSRIVIPRIYWEYSAPGVLTMDYVQGVHPDDSAGLDALGVNRRDLAQEGVNTMLKQFLLDGFFHADPHPGNFVVTPSGQLCLIDFGMVGYLSAKQRRELAGCFTSFLDKDIEGFTRHYLHLASSSEESDVSGFKKDISEVLSAFFYSSQKLSAASAMTRVMQRGAQRNVTVPSDLALFGKAMMSAEALGLKIYPRFNLNRMLRPFIWRIWEAYLSPQSLWRSIQTDFFDYASFLSNLPEQTQAIMARLESGQLNIHVDTKDIREMKQEFDMQTNRRILGFAVTALFALAALLLALEGYNFFGFPVSGVALILAGLLLIWYILRTRVHRHGMLEATRE